MNSKPPIPSSEELSVRALRAIAQSPLTKSHLAQLIYGGDDASTRSMVTRLTANLRNARLIEERKVGRERIVELTAEGRARLAKFGKAGGAEVQSVTLATALRTQPEHASDRPRFHLRHAALLALDRFMKGSQFSRADQKYEEMLLHLVHDPGDQANPNTDLQVFESTKQGWSNRDPRRGLVEALARFENEESRRATGPLLLALADKVKGLTGADQVLWATVAIDLAHHYSFSPASQVDRLAARSLLRQVKDVLDRSKSEPELAVACEYRMGKAAQVAALGWTWAPKAAPVSKAESEEKASADDLPTTLRVLDGKVRRAGAFNGVLEQFERTLASTVSRWTMQAMPSAEWVFRRSGGVALAEEIRDWAQDTRSGGNLRELLVIKTKEHPHLTQKLTEFLGIAKEYAEEFPETVQPHIEQAEALLGEPVKAVTPDYKGMLLNNLWTPEMVVAHAITTPVPNPGAGHEQV